MSDKPTPAEMRAAEKIRNEVCTSFPLNGDCSASEMEAQLSRVDQRIAAIIHREMETERSELVDALKKCEAELQKNTRYFHSFGHLVTADSIDGVISIARAVLAKYEQENNER